MYAKFKQCQLTLTWLDALSGKLQHLIFNSIKEKVTPEDIAKLTELIKPLMPLSFELKEVLLTEKYNYLQGE